MSSPIPGVSFQAPSAPAPVKELPKVVVASDASYENFFPDVPELTILGYKLPLKNNNRAICAFQRALKNNFDGNAEGLGEVDFMYLSAYAYAESARSQLRFRKDIPEDVRRQISNATFDDWCDWCPGPEELSNLLVSLMAPGEGAAEGNSAAD